MRRYAFFNGRIESHFRLISSLDLQVHRKLQASSRQQPTLVALRMLQQNRPTLHVWTCHPRISRRKDEMIVIRIPFHYQRRLGLIAQTSDYFALTFETHCRPHNLPARRSPMFRTQHVGRNLDKSSPQAITGPHRPHETPEPPYVLCFFASPPPSSSFARFLSSSLRLQPPPFDTTGVWKLSGLGSIFESADRPNPHSG